MYKGFVYFVKIWPQENQKDFFLHKLLKTRVTERIIASKNNKTEEYYQKLSCV